MTAYAYRLLTTQQTGQLTIYSSRALALLANKSTTPYNVDLHLRSITAAKSLSFLLLNAST